MSYKQTIVWNVDNIEGERSLDPGIKEAALWIKRGEAVAFPTETVYGLGADATNDEAVEKIFEAKGRPGDNPLIVHIGNQEQLSDLASSVPPLAQKLAEHFWPGPLTLILPKKQEVSSKVTAGLDTVAVRMPDHEAARALIKEAGVPVAAPSANQSGRPSPTKAEHVKHDLSGKVAGIVDGGSSGFGLESTVVDCSGEIAWILRPGGITKEQLEEVLGKDRIGFENRIDPHNDDDEMVSPKAPGMKYRHYAPDSPLILLRETKAIKRRMETEQKAGNKVAVLAVEEHRSDLEPAADIFIVLGSSAKLEGVAAHLYDNLRQADQSDADIILCETFSLEGVGLAIMNRLEKASAEG
ncbi:L-threonylcarbamoyladenylate synthase [Alteribacillus bidgolensis]|uniref:Threonylcarbamoyl-AMP synthase n=1 Tax=Alteribacillus bidgolensis TaxID=930129 RepID=A0A1G8M216_9BACI|nr:L-threonylcarbamoyladenylate synthase [Alteribacillus bidgolensis]SDI61893.1 translation factor SUA5 [Alteribacillus bidgolensis]